MGQSSVNRGLKGTCRSGKATTGERPLPRPRPVACVSEPDDQGSQRNVWCPFYVDCLDVATDKWWSDFSCSRCRNRTLSAKPRAEELPNLLSSAEVAEFSLHLANADTMLA